MASQSRSPMLSPCSPVMLAVIADLVLAIGGTVPTLVASGLGGSRRLARAVSARFSR